MFRLGEIYFNYCSRGKCTRGLADSENLDLLNVLYFVRHQLLVHCQDSGTFSWAAIYNCNVCGEDCFDKANYKRHMFDKHSTTEADDRTPNKCRFCNKTYKSKSILYYHIRNIHPGKDEEEVCAFCGKSFKHISMLKHHHKLVHVNDPQKCELCGKVFMNPMRLKVHKFKVHRSIDKQKQCAVCGSRFKLSWNLTVHMRKHEKEQARLQNYDFGETGVMPSRQIETTTAAISINPVKYHCDIMDCGAEFENEHALRVHYENYHQIEIN